MPDHVSNQPSAGIFRTTHWSLVLAAADSSPEGEHALETLCRAYWYPLYVFARRRGHAPHEAEDITQAFFAQLLSGDGLRRVHPDNGKFRSFLLASMKYFLASHWRDANRLKRGGGQKLLSWDELHPEERYKIEPSDQRSPEEAFDQHWAQTLAQASLDALRQEMEAEGGGARFEALKPYLQHHETAPVYEDCAKVLGMTEMALKSAIHRLRRRYAEIVREQISHTVGSPLEVEAEIRHLITMLAG